MVLGGVVEQDIERSLGEKELMGRVIDFLPSEIPDVETEVPSVR
jgi:hypothetical protein